MSNILIQDEKRKTQLKQSFTNFLKKSKIKQLFHVVNDFMFIGSLGNNICGMTSLHAVTRCS